MLSKLAFPFIVQTQFSITHPFGFIEYTTIPIGFSIRTTDWLVDRLTFCMSSWVLAAGFVSLNVRYTGTQRVAYSFSFFLIIKRP